MGKRTAKLQRKTSANVAIITFPLITTADNVTHSQNLQKTQSNMNKPKTHGGARKGAGTKKTRTADRVAITMRVEPEIAEKFKRICKDGNVSQAGQFSDMVQREEVGCKSLLAELLSVACSDPECHTLHHTVREYHDADEPCPAKARYLTAIRKAEEFFIT